MFELFARDALALAALPAQARVVDVAAGPGTLAFLAAAAGATVEAIDFSQNMLDQLLARKQSESTSSVNARLGDGQALPFPDESFDRGFSMFGLMFFPDRGAGFRELRRVLKPGGRAVVSSWLPFVPPFTTMLEAVRAELPGLPFGKGEAPLGDPAVFERELTAAGFRDVAINPTSHIMKVDTLDGFWASMQRTNAPLLLLQRKLGEERWREVARGVHQRLRESVGDGPFEVPFRALLGMGVR